MAGNGFYLGAAFHILKWRAVSDAAQIRTA